MELMKKDLKTQIENEKDILRGFKKELDNNLKLSGLKKYHIYVYDKTTRKYG